MPQPDAEMVPLLRLDPALGAGLDEETLAIASRAIGVETTTIPAGPWDPPKDQPEPGYLGYLILEGVTLRELLVAGDRSLEVLSAGDVVVPWQEDAASFVEVSRSVLTELRVAIVDRSAAAGIAQVPEVMVALMGRLLSRSRSLAVYAAIAGMPGLEDRLITLFWQLAERWGTVAQEGVSMPLQLTHQMLADIVGARRPSVTLALGVLAEEGLIKNDPDGGWTLTGGPPSPHRSPRSTSSD